MECSVFTVKRVFRECSLSVHTVFMVWLRSPHRGCCEETELSHSVAVEWRLAYVLPGAPGAIRETRAVR